MRLAVVSHICAGSFVAVLGTVAIGLVSVPVTVASNVTLRQRATHVESVVAHSAIIGGSFAEGSSFASLAFVRDVRGDEAGECTGTVVAPDAVMTAAHCVENIRTGVLNPAAGYTIATGSVNLTSPTVQLSTVSQVVVDPLFRPLRATGDAALLILSTPTSAPAVVLPIAGSPGIRPGRLGVIAGWGAIFYGQRNLGARLRRADVVVRNASWCTRHARRFAPGSELCTIHPPRAGGGICNGDSGGPLLLNLGDGNPVDVGIISRGSPTCSIKEPVVLTSTRSVSKWVAATLASLPSV
jgi:secreted trypsin-like serine protease